MDLRAVVVLCLLGVLLFPATSAQEVEIVRVSLDVDEDRLQTAIKQRAEFVITVRDESLDGPNRVPGGPEGGVIPHNTDFSIEIEKSSPVGWILEKPSGFQSFTGDARQVVLGVFPTPQIESRAIQINFTATIRNQQGDEHTQTVLLFVDTPGIPSLQATATSLGEPMRPREIRDGVVTIRNNAQLPRLFAMELTDSSRCGLTLVPANPTAIGPTQAVDVTFSVQAPADKIWYQSEDCPIRVRIYDVNAPDMESSTVVGSTVNGWYLDPVWIFWTVAGVVAVIILFILFKRRKEAVEEEILGKPQKPWTIPVERVYLEHLEEEDERAAYVVRHFLMEEEYQSALLWYKSYKKATKGRRAKERVVVGQEKKYRRFKKKWEKKIAEPIQAADRFEAKLQKKLDRKAKKAVKSDRKKWKKVVAKMDSAHEKKKQRELGKWEKAAKKAEKKGQEAPPKPEIPAPDYPPEPQWQRIELEDHKWQAKADKFRRKMIKRQGDLEVKFEKKEARLLAKLQRKVRRIGRKLDDPDFEREHPIVGSSSSDS